MPPSYTLCLECISNMILRTSHELKYVDFKKTNNPYPLDSEVGTSHKREKEFFLIMLFAPHHPTHPPLEVEAWMSNMPNLQEGGS